MHPRTRLVRASLLVLAAVSLNPIAAQTLEILGISREENVVSLQMLAPTQEIPAYVLEFSPTLEAASWEPREAAIDTSPTGELHLSTEIPPDLAGFFRVRLPAGPSLPTSLRLNEIMSDNETTLVDGDGDFPDWIELRNTGETPLNLEGFGLSDRSDRLGKWKFPAGVTLDPGAVLLVFASGKEGAEIPSGELHASFQIGNGREAIYLSDPEDRLLDSLDPGPLAADASVGLARDDGQILYPFQPQEATPGKPNHSFLFGAPDPFIQAPRFSRQPGPYQDSVTVELVAPREGDLIRYTLDGSEPFHSLFSSNSTLYTAPLQIEGPTVIRAKVFAEKARTSRTVSATYLVGVNHSLAVVSLITEPGSFEFADGYLYGMGAALSANGQVNGNFPFTASNAWKSDREVEASLELFAPEDDEPLSMNVGVKIFGGWGSRGYPQKSLALFARQAYGYGRIRYPIFPESEVDSFESLVLRNSGNDNQSTWLTPPRTEIRAFSEPASYGSYFVNGNFTLFRDAMVQSLARETGLDTQAYRPAVLYLNGDYWGIYNIREKLTEHYVESHYDIDSDNVDLIEGYGSANAGSSAAYNQMRNEVTNRDLDNPDNLQWIEDNLVDIDNFIDYHLTIIWGQNFDIGNIKCWRPRLEEGGRFRWLVYDQDYAFNLWKPEVYLPAMKRDFSDYENMFDFHTNPSGTGTGWPNAGGRTLLLREMLESEAFRERFIQRCADLLNHLWSAERVVDRIDTMADVIRPEIARHLQRWSWEGVAARGFSHPHKPEDEPLDLAHWERNVEVMRAFARARPEQLRAQLMEHFGFTQGTATVAVIIAESDKGSVIINNRLTVPEAFWEGTYFRDLPPTVEAVAKPGHTFTGWSGALQGTEARQLLPLDQAQVTVEAAFQ